MRRQNGGLTVWREKSETCQSSAQRKRKIWSQPSMRRRAPGGMGGGRTDMQVADGYIRYCADGQTWENLIALAELKGADGRDGAKGDKGEPARRAFRVKGANPAHEENKARWAQGKTGVQGHPRAEGRQGRSRRAGAAR